MTEPTIPGPLDQITCVHGEAFVVSDANGDIVRGGDLGVYVRDTRFLDVLVLLVDGHRPRPLVGGNTDPSVAVFQAFAPMPDDRADPTLLVDRRRVIDGCMHEEVRLTNRGRSAVEVEVGFRIGTDFAYIFDVRHGRVREPVAAEAVPDGLRFVREDEVDEVVVTLQPPPDRREADLLAVTCRLDPGGTTRVCLDVVGKDVYGPVRPLRRCEALEQPSTATTAKPLTAEVAVRCSDLRFTQLVEHGLRDLAALRMSDPDQPLDAFCAAGSPWYLTLFGRDSLWTAFMAAPFDVALAGGTLRTLARRQGTRDDRDTEEAPGKILHEIRRGSLTHRGDLPPNYYGTIDATPLFVVLAHEAWRCGLPEDQVAALLPNVEAALGWLTTSGDPDGDGFLEYAKRSDRGLDNQGWKDSHDGVQFADATLATPPIALSEVQAYAHDAARRGADLLEHFGRPGAEQWRSWADDLADRFRSTFWIDDDHGRYPAIALDHRNRPVDGPASNMGHLLASGMLDATEAGQIAAQLAHPRLFSGWGLRTLSTTATGYNPLSYHAGSVWPHDTAIAVWGLAVARQHDAAVTLLQGLVDAAPRFDHRLPELFGGHDREQAPAPVPYPAACRPQAWAAGGALLLLRACLGLQPDLPRGRLTLAPLWPPPFRTLEVELPMAGRTIDVRVDQDTGVEVDLHGLDLALEVVPGQQPPG